MLTGLSQHLLPVLQLTRMALVFTAISNSLCTLLLALRREVGPTGAISSVFRWDEAVLVVLMSIGLYGFGMSLNDIIDRRRDQQLASHRPLPSGRIGVIAAHVICVLLLLLGIASALIYARLTNNPRTVALVFGTAILIAFYDFAGKYLVALGLLTLGLIRLFHALTPAPYVPLIWHPLLLFTHVAVLSAVCYAWEEKRPPLTRLHWWGVVGGVIAFDLFLIGLSIWRFSDRPGVTPLWIRPGLLLPLGGMLGFVLLAWRIRKGSSTPRQAGQALMLAGLLWLIVYDACFAAAYVGRNFLSGLMFGGVLLLLLPVSYLSVQLMRWWSQILMLSQPPTFKRVRSGP